MPKCKGCGIELLEGTVFCPYCGQAVEETEKPAEPVQPEQNEQPEQPQFEQPQYGAPQYGQPYYGAPLPKRENKGVLELYDDEIYRAPYESFEHDEVNEVILSNELPTLNPVNVQSGSLDLAPLTVTFIVYVT